MVYLSSHKPLLYRSPSLYDLNPFAGRNGTQHHHHQQQQQQQQHHTKQLNARYATTLQPSTRCTHRRAGSTWAVNNSNHSSYGPSSCCIYDNNIIYVPQEDKPPPSNGIAGTLSRKTSTSCSQLSSLGRTTSCYNIQELGPKKKLRKRQLCRSMAVVNGQSTLEHTMPANNNFKSHRQIERAKQRASIMWLIAKANDDGRVPEHLRDPFYRDYEGHEVLKPWITQRLANGELYGRALANIYGSPDYSTYSHLQILQHLQRKGVFNDMIAMSGEEPINETLLLKTSPVRVNEHMIIIECILMLYVKEIMILEKVADVVSRFTGHSLEQMFPEGVADLNSDVEEVALFWINRACHQLNVEIEKDYHTTRAMTGRNSSTGNDDADDNFCPLIPMVDALTDMCDGCSLLGLFAYYCPDFISHHDICLKQDILITDSICNHKRVQYFCDEHFPTDICFLTVEDFLYLQESIVPNFLAFIADLLHLFEIQSIHCVSPMYMRICATESDYGNEFQPNYPALPTPSEMRARSLKHQTWNDSLDTSSDTYQQQHQEQQQARLYGQRGSVDDGGGHAANNKGNNLTMNLSTSNSRRDSTTGSANIDRALRRRSSLISNGSEKTTLMPSNPHEPEYAVIGNGNENGNTSNLDNGQLSTYFSTLSIASNNKNNLNDEYYPNHQANSNNKRNETIAAGTSSTSQQLNDYFASLSGDQTLTHVKAKANHPNNADNVKGLLNMQNNRREYSSPYEESISQAGNSSESSSVAEMSEFNDQLVRQQLSEKRKQIELGRARENEKRLSSNANFRQEVFKTLKGSDYLEADEIDRAVGEKNNDDDSLTFEVHELNPILKLEKTTSQKSIASSIGATSTYSKRNLFSASEDLKSSITDLHYSKSMKSTDTITKGKQADLNLDEEKVEQKRTIVTPPSNITTNTTYPSVVTTPSQQHPQPIAESTSATISTPTVASSSSVPESVAKPLEQLQQEQPMVVPPAMINGLNPLATSTPSRPRSQWGQPMMPLSGQYATPISQAQQPPPGWPVGPVYGAGPEQWYGHHQTYAHHPAAYHPGPPHYPMGPIPQPNPYNMNLDHSSPYNGFPQTSQENTYMSIGYIHPQQQQQQQHHQQQQQPAQLPMSTPPAPIQQQQQQPSQPVVHQNVSAVFSEEFPLSGKPPSQQIPGSQGEDSTKAKQEAESFFITFNDEKPLKKVVKNVSTSVRAKSATAGPVEGHDALSRKTTQTLLAHKSEEEEGERLKQLYDVKRTVSNVPAVSFVIGVDEDKEEAKKKLEESNPYRAADISPEDQSNENEMTKKKELIMRQSLKRRLEQEEKRLQKEQELATQREIDREKREMAERKKEEERAKRAFILEQYKQRKQMAEEIEKNGGMAAMNSVSRSSSTLVLNRTPSSGVMLRNRGLSSAGSVRPRPKSLHATMLDGGSMAGVAAAPGVARGAATGTGRFSASRDEIDLIARFGSTSRTQSAMSSALTSPISGPGGYSFGDGESSLSNWSTAQYNGPKLFVKPTQKSNKTLILNAINVVLAGAVNAETNKKVAQVINSCDSKHYLILFRNSGLQYRAIYAYYPEREEVAKLDGTGPKAVNNEMIDKFFKYNSGTKSFAVIHTKHLCVTIDAFTIHDHLWTRAKQQQHHQQLNASSTMLRRF